MNSPEHVADAIQKTVRLVPDPSGLSASQVRGLGGPEAIVCIEVDPATWRATTVMRFGLSGLNSHERSLMYSQAKLVLNMRATKEDALMAILPPRIGQMPGLVLQLTEEEICYLSMGPGSWRLKAVHETTEGTQFEYHDQDDARVGFAMVTERGQVISHSELMTERQSLEMRRALDSERTSCN
jgi:hypothetical protein